MLLPAGDGREALNAGLVSRERQCGYALRRPAWRIRPVQPLDGQRLGPAEMLLVHRFAMHRARVGANRWRPCPAI